MGSKPDPECLKRYRELYARMGRRGKSRLLSEFCEMWGCHRKHAIRLFNAAEPEANARGGRPAVYGPAAAETLRSLWLKMDQPCSKLFKAGLPIWLSHYEQSHGALAEPVRTQLLALSPATIDRLLAPHRARMRPKGRCATRPGSLLRKQIPVRTNFWTVDRPGYIEADSVSHGGSTTRGDYVWSLTFTDIWSGWTEQAAIWNKGAQATLDATRQVEARLVFPILGFDCDNGGEFLNHHLSRYFLGRPAPVEFTRSRAYHCNDNAHVEQKQWTHVRQLLGYERLDDPALVALINDLYVDWGLLKNFFMPTMKLKEKRRDGGRVRRVYEPPRTPHQRLIASPHVGSEAKRRLEKLWAELDPFCLRRRIEAALAEIWKRVRAARAPGAPPPDPRSLPPRDNPDLISARNRSINSRDLGQADSRPKAGSKTEGRTRVKARP